MADGCVVEELINEGFFVLSGLGFGVMLLLHVLCVCMFS